MLMAGLRKYAGLAAFALLAACVPLPQVDRPAPPTAPAPDVPPTAALLGITAGPAPGAIGFLPDDAALALASFIESCPVLLRREDTSGLTRQDDWRSACTTAASWPRGDAATFFSSEFETVRVGDGAAFATGYFEPEILGSRQWRTGFDAPVYALPGDLVRAWPDETPQADRTGNPPLGRHDAQGRFVRYFDRTEIEQGALAGRGLEIGWAADPVELFFLQIQGSGRLVTPEGEVIRIGYAGQNGHGYTGIGAVMRERGLIGTGPGQYPGSMQGIMQYIRENPAEGRDLMRLNKSWVFFRELTGDGPIGSIGVPVRPRASVAVDPRYVPYGAPVFLATENPDARGLWIAQDTGGAIRGPNRFDTFWGAGTEARRIAGGMSTRGQAVVLLPKGTLARLLAQ